MSKVIKRASNAPTVWDVQLGSVSPRDKTIGWRSHSMFSDLAEAEKYARQMAKNDAIVRIVQQREALLFYPESASISLVVEEFAT